MLTFLEKQEKLLPYLQMGLFVFLIILLQNKLFTVAFTVLIGFILYLALSSNQKRLFSWTIFAFLLGHLFYLYGDRLVDELPFRVSTRMVLNRGLLLIPILFIIYVTKKFKAPINYYWVKTDWKAKIYFPFIWRGFHSLSIKQFLLAAISINLIVFFPFILKANLSFQFSFLSFLILFSLINGLLEEILWRGILLTRMVELAGEKMAIVFSGIAFGLSHLAFGFSYLTCLGFSIGGIFYAGIVIRSGSIIPAIIWHFAFNLLMILSGLIPYIG